MSKRSASRLENFRPNPRDVNATAQVVKRDVNRSVKKGATIRAAVNAAAGYVRA